jgi:hypothetical protein
VVLELDQAHSQAVEAVAQLLSEQTVLLVVAVMVVRAAMLIQLGQLQHLQA